MTIERMRTPAEAAKILGISLKTLRVLIANGRIRSVPFGEGKTRKHRRFTDKNIASFIEASKVREIPKCQSTSLPKVPSIGTTSGSTIVAFTSLQKPGTAKKLNG